MEQIATQTESPVVLLKNGEQASRVIVKEIMSKLHDIMNKEPNGALLLNELIMRCMDEQYECFDGCSWRLCSHGLFDSDGHVKSSVRAIVLSSIIGHWPKLGFSSPIQAD